MSCVQSAFIRKLKELSGDNILPRKTKLHSIKTQLRVKFLGVAKFVSKNEGMLSNNLSVLILFKRDQYFLSINYWRVLTRQDCSLCWRNEPGNLYLATPVEEYENLEKGGAIQQTTLLLLLVYQSFLSGWSPTSLSIFLRL